jgi:hypothetical protein
MDLHGLTGTALLYLKVQLSQGALWEDFLLQVHLTRAILRSCTASRQSTQATKGIADRGEKRPPFRAAAFATTGISETWSVSTGT